MSSAGTVTRPVPGRELRLAQAVASLAQSPPSTEAARRNPVAPGSAENLVFEFDEAYTSFVEGFDQLPSEAQLLVLQAVDTQVSRMIRASDPAIWTDVARREHPEWDRLRLLAEAVLHEFGWPGT